MPMAKPEIRQNIYDMREETVEFLKNVDVVELPSNEHALTLVPIESDKKAEWFRRWENSKGRIPV